MHNSCRKGLDSNVADRNNISGSPYAGAIVAALFLERFVSPATRWAHFDIMAWNLASRPGRPEGGEALGLRAVYAAIVVLIKRAPAQKGERARTSFSQGRAGAAVAGLTGDRAGEE